METKLSRARDYAREVANELVALEADTEAMKWGSVSAWVDSALMVDTVTTYNDNDEMVTFETIVLLCDDKTMRVVVRFIPDKGAIVETLTDYVVESRWVDCPIVSVLV